MIPLMIVPTVFIFLFSLSLSHAMILMIFFLGQDTPFLILSSFRAHAA
jgi:hypothetical protein